jgi:hypothetical protein
MAMSLGASEPTAVPWQVVPITAVVASVINATGRVQGRPRIVAIDGRSSSGKTTLARRLEAVIPGAVTVHTDDVAWFHAAFDWVDLLIAGVLGPVRCGEPVAFRPPAWEPRERAGAIEVSLGAPVVLLEGVGAGRRELVDMVDAVIYVQCDLEVRARRDEERIASGEVARDVVERWIAEEVSFVDGQRPWERACLVVAGTPTLPHDPVTELVVAAPPTIEEQDSAGVGR